MGFEVLLLKRKKQLPLVELAESDIVAINKSFLFAQLQHYFSDIQLNGDDKLIVLQSKQEIEFYLHLNKFDEQQVMSFTVALRGSSVILERLEKIKQATGCEAFSMECQLIDQDYIEKYSRWFGEVAKEYE